MLLIVFSFMCYLKTKREFIIFLDILFVINIFSWKFLIRFIEQSVSENKEFYKTRHKYFKIVYLQLLITDYLRGNWQWYRFLIGGIVLLSVNLLIFTNLTQLIASAVNIKSIELIKSLGFAIFILVMEGWVWFMRLKRSNCIDLIDDLDEDYYLMERKSSTNK